MKIGVINNLFEPYSRGGAEVVVENINRGLMEKDHQIFLITLGRKNEKDSREKLTIYRIKPKNIFSYLDIGSRPFFLRVFWHIIDMFNFSSFYQIKKTLLQEKPDIIITHNLKGIGFLIPRLLRNLKIRHVHYLHDIQLSRPSGIMLAGQEKPFLILDKIYEKICRWLFLSPHVVVSPSGWLMKYYTRRGFFYHSKQFILSSGVTIKDDQQNPKASSSGQLTLLFLGQMEGSKGILFLIDVLKELPSREWVLKIVGTGSMEDKIRKHTAGDKRFQVYGYVRHSRLGLLFEQSDYTVVPSLVYENAPMVIFESLSHGVPVIASDIGGIPEIVEDNVNGYIFEPGNKKNLLELLEFILKHPEERQRLAANAAQSAKKVQSDIFIKKFLEILEQS